MLILNEGKLEPSSVGSDSVGSVVVVAASEFRVIRTSFINFVEVRFWWGI